MLESTHAPSRSDLSRVNRTSLTRVEVRITIGVRTPRVGEDAGAGRIPRFKHLGRQVRGDVERPPSTANVVERDLGPRRHTSSLCVVGRRVGCARIAGPRDGPCNSRARERFRVGSVASTTPLVPSRQQRTRDVRAVPTGEVNSVVPRYVLNDLPSRRVERRDVPGRGVHVPSRVVEPARAHVLHGSNSIMKDTPTSGPETDRAMQACISLGLRV